MDNPLYKADVLSRPETEALLKSASSISIADRMILSTLLRIEYGMNVMLAVGSANGRTTDYPPTPALTNEKE